MKLKCRLGRHSPIRDFSKWNNGYHLSACADCATPMKKPGGGEWRALRPDERELSALSSG